MMMAAGIRLQAERLDSAGSEPVGIGLQSVVNFRAFDHDRITDGRL
jgi:hypothetical protein